MTQMQLDRQIARITGEPLSTVSTLGFSVIAEQPDDLEPEDVELVLDCPFCRRPVPIPARPATAPRRWPNATGATSTSRSTPPRSTRSRTATCPRSRGRP